MRKRKYTESVTVEAGISLTEDIDACTRARNQGDAPCAEVHNLVGTGKIYSSVLPLDLKHVSRVLPNTHFDKQKFAAITVRLHAPMCTVLLFTSGKLVLTGAKTFCECLYACSRVLQLLRNGFPGITFKLQETNIQNIVGNVDLRLCGSQRMDLETFHSDHSVYCTYQKNMFPGLIFRPLNSPVVMLLFASGKIVLTGAKSAAVMHKGWHDIWPLVTKYVTEA
jgi:transcription initiation factor TFIID TATA-box-binding protein